jgi:hypothetical protein
MAKARNYKRLTLGDIIEIPLSKSRVAYAQYVFNHREEPVWGHFIRVFPGIFSKRPTNFAELSAAEPQFCAFYPAGTAVSRGLIRIVDHADIPKQFRRLPLFKSANTNFHTGKKSWWLWDGEKEWRVGELSPEHYDLPVLQLITHDVLVERIKKRWRHRDEIHDVPPIKPQLG